MDTVEEGSDAGHGPRLPLVEASPQSPGSPDADAPADPPEATEDAPRGQKRKQPEELQETEEQQQKADASGEGAEHEELTAKEKRMRGIPTLDSPERTSELPEDEGMEPESPEEDPKEKTLPKDPTAEAGEAKEKPPQEEGKAAAKKQPGVSDSEDDWGIDFGKDAKEGPPDAASGEQKGKPGVSESEDDWGMDFAKPGKEENLMDEIRKQQETNSGWEFEKWVSAPSSDKGDGKSSEHGGPPGSKAASEHAPSERELNDEDDWKGLFPQKDAEEDEEEVDESYWYNDVEPDDSWSLWPPNSKEALAGTVLVQKIRARAGKAKTPGGPFPGEAVGEAFVKLMSQPKKEQKVLLAALLWIEANVMEVKVVPPDLSEAVTMLLHTEGDALRSIAENVPDTVMRTKAGSMIPPREVRKNSDTTVEELVSGLHELLPETFGSKEELNTLVGEELGHLPVTVRIAALVHACEFVRLKGSKRYGTLDAVAVAFAKQRLPERAVEVVCRLTLERSMSLANSTLSAEVEEVRAQKIKVLSRLHKEWRLRPSEEQLSQLHIFGLEEQLKILLEIERDIELYWVKMLGRVKSEVDRARELASLLNFSKLLKPHLRQEAVRKVPLHAESGHKLTTGDVARVRGAVADVLAKLYERYRWVPDLASRRLVSKTNWVARLSALLTLAGMPECLHADVELRQLLAKEGHKKLGLEVLTRFEQWAKLEEGTGVVIKAPKVVDAAHAEENRRLYQEYMPDPTKVLTASGYQPKTPGGLGQIAAMPATPGFGVFGAFAAPGTPGMGIRAAMTPAGPPPAGARGLRPPGTPAGPPPGTPGLMMPGTPSGAVPSTPAGPPPATPGGFYRAPGTPAGPPPPTPGGFGVRPPGTPAGPPPPTPGGFGFRPGGAPMTPAGVGMPVPMTPMGAGRAYASVPSTPAGLGSAAPMTPAAALGGAPGSPHDKTPSTPKDAPARIPATPAEAFGPGTFIPSTPVGAGSGLSRIPSTPAEALSSSSMIPRTPIGSTGRIPSTPAAAFADAGRTVPMTPARPGAAPFTPGAPVPQTPGSTVPMTPAPGGMGTAAPFTPAGPVPRTPAGPGAAAPFTPAGPAPFTPAGPAPMTPAGAF
uniref:Uncharacterized protein n=1 Tax=Alexandrium monilatum TaxID=311494 RepID=A0A7S4WF58_9DINO